MLTPKKNANFTIYVAFGSLIFFPKNQLPFESPQFPLQVFVEIIPVPGVIVIMLVLTVSVIGFIFMLVSLILIVIYINNIQNGKYNSDGTAKDTFGIRVKEAAINVVDDTKEVLGIKTELEKQTEALIQALKMKESGLIRDEEYAGLRKKILGI